MRGKRSKDDATIEGHEEKRPYDPPRIISREPLEVVALLCQGFGAKSSGDPACFVTQLS